MVYVNMDSIIVGKIERMCGEVLLNVCRCRCCARWLKNSQNKGFCHPLS